MAYFVSDAWGRGACGWSSNTMKRNVRLGREELRLYAGLRLTIGGNQEMHTTHRRSTN